MDRKQFDELALEHVDAVYRMALQLSHHPDEAGDLVQETYLKALNAADGFQIQGGGIRPWLFKILHNAFYTRISRSKRESPGGDDLLLAQSGDPAPDDPAPAWDLASLDWEQVDDRLKAAIDKLKPDYRSILLMWGVENMKYREIADVLDIPIGTVMSRLHRARSILAQELSEMAEEKRLSAG